MTVLNCKYSIITTSRYGQYVRNYDKKVCSDSEINAKAEIIQMANRDFKRAKVVFHSIKEVN